jgi:hypothetical protein
MKELLVDLTVRLPDVSSYASLSPEYARYGRFAVTNSGHFWVADVVSSHPSNMKDGFYWAISKGKLLISPRGSTYGYPNNFTPSLLANLLEYLHLKPEIVVLKKSDEEVVRFAFKAKPVVATSVKSPARPISRPVRRAAVKASAKPVRARSAKSMAK